MGVLVSNEDFKDLLSGDLQTSVHTLMGVLVLTEEFDFLQLSGDSGRTSRLLTGEEFNAALFEFLISGHNITGTVESADEFHVLLPDIPSSETPELVETDKLGGDITASKELG